MVDRILQLIGYQPSIVVLLWAFWTGARLDVALQFDLLFRFAKTAGALLHEHAHLSTAVIICGTLRGITTKENCLGNVALCSHLLQVLPGMPCPHATHVTLPTCTDAWHACAVHIAGLIASAMLVLFSHRDGTSPFLLAALLNFGMAISSDFLAVWNQDWALGRGTFGCGNWGLLIPANKINDKQKCLFPKQIEQLLQGVLGVVELRGAQAGGICLFTQGRSSNIFAVVAHAVKKKRAQLPQAIFSNLWWQLVRLQVSSVFGFKQPEVLLAQGHSRFGTSSPPALRETHPHQWVGTVKERFWSFNVVTSEWMCTTVPLCVTITHNGDFDEWKPYNEMLGVKELGFWLERVLAKPNSTRGDSPKICGLMDLLITKGSWFRSVRFAYTLFVMTHVEQVSGWAPLSKEAPNTMPKENILRSWAAAFDNVFKSYIDYHSPEKSYVSQPVWDPEVGFSDDVQTGIIIEDLVNHASASLVSLMVGSGAAAFDTFVPSERVRAAFINSAVRAFLQQDVLTATWQFFRRAQGTFGVSVSCTAWPSSCVLAAKGQPISVGFDNNRSLALWTSEPASLAVTWTAEAAHGPAATTRWDLLDDVGEALEIQVLPANITCEQANSTLLFPAVRAPFFAFPCGTSDATGKGLDNALIVRGCSLAASPTALDDAAFAARLVDLSFAGIDSPLQPQGAAPSRCSLWSWSPRPDPVSADIAEIPRVLHNIDQIWQDSHSLNRQSADNFAQRLCSRIESIRTEERGAEPEIDLLVTGIEGSHWIGQQFVADITRVFPSLHAVALSSNFVVGLLQGSAGRVEPLNFPVNSGNFKFANGSICLALSQSGTTYPTVWAARLLKKRTHCEVFAMSGHFDTVLAASVGQSLALKHFHGNLFSTKVGIRPAEPSTVASVAMHHTLSHLLHVCMKSHVEVWQLQPGNRQLRPEEASDFQKILLALKGSAQHLCGTTASGHELETTARAQLLQMGDHWASHLTEGYWATFWVAIYIYASVSAGMPLISTVWAATGRREVPVWVPRVLDAHLYVFLAAIVCVIHRVATGRRLWTRFCSRTVVVVDVSTMNYKLLRAYITKLRALAFRFTTFSVLGQNPTDHFVHEMTHLTTSDVLVAVGRPDGRLATLAASEAAVIMSLQQAKFIKKASSGIEAFSLGHNPWTNAQLFTNHISLPTEARPVFLSQHLMTKKGNGHGNSSSNVCSPEEVVSRLLAIHSGKHMGAHAPDLPCITFAELQSLSQGRAELPRSEVRSIISAIVEEQAMELELDPSHFDIFRVLPGKDSKCSTTASRSSIRPKLAIESNPSPNADASESDSSAESCSDQEETTDSNNTSNLYRRGRPKRIGPFLRGGMSEFLRGRSSSASCKASNSLTLQEVMTLIRSPAMKSEIQQCRKTKQRRMGTKELTAAVGSRLKAVGLSLAEVFQAWHFHALEMVPRSPLDLKPAEAGYWRQKEAYLTAARTYPMVAEMFRRPPSLRETFTAWSLLAAHLLAGVRARAVGACWEHSTAPLKHVLDMQCLMEHLYETRVASIERLIGFFVLFHKMVLPISRVPFLGFAIDRTESRLRVASTPAPVAVRGNQEDGLLLQGKRRGKTHQRSVSREML